MMVNIRCPYCGGEMRYAFNGDTVGTHFLICETCLSRSPAVSFDDDPYAAAMRREKKGEWIESIDEYSDGNVPNVNWYCSVCGEKGINDDNYCPNCGAKMNLTNPRSCPNCGSDMRGERK